MDSNWIPGEANTGLEMICPGKHIKQSEWSSLWNDNFKTPHYDYISDYECNFPHPVVEDYFDRDELKWSALQSAKQQGTILPIRNLVHFTNDYNAEKIIDNGGFTGEEKQVGESILEHFTWWSPAFNTRPPEEENESDNEDNIDTIGLVRDRLLRVIKIFADENDDVQQLANQFATSDAFHPNPLRYGNVSFTYSIDDLCVSYEDYTGEEIQFKVLRTFMYKQEIMHAVLVCGEEAGNDIFDDYPSVPQPTSDGAQSEKEVVTRDEAGCWLWNPQATATRIARLQRFRHYQYPMYRRWENVAFAFHLKCNDCMHVTDLIEHKETITDG